MEKDLEKKLVKEIKALDGLCLKWVCPSRRGAPDRIVILPNGMNIFVELKTEKGISSKVQINFHKELIKRNQNFYLLKGEAGLLAFIKKIKILLEK